MMDEQNDGSSKSRVSKILDSIDRFSKNFEYSKKEESTTLKDSKFSVNKEKKSANSFESTYTGAIKNPLTESKVKELNDLIERIRRRSGSLFKSIFINLQYLIPGVIIFQAALWVAYLSDNSISNGFVTTIVDDSGDIVGNIMRLFSIFGAIIAYTISSSFDSHHSLGTFSMSPNFSDLFFLLLIFSSALYIMKKFQSLYFLSITFLLSFIIRILDVNNHSYDWSVITLVILSSIIFIFASSIPLSRYKIRKDLKDSMIDFSAITQKSSITEASYQKPLADTSGIPMDQAPVTKPRRPSRRSEYELYEWVLLLANLILWPAVFFISIILGSGVEMYGNTYNMDENYLMLLGPLFLTLFFFGILFKMDKNARDGSLYAAEKQSYLEEMEKYLKARTAYLELVTLQAESKKQEIVSTSEE